MSYWLHERNFRPDFTVEKNSGGKLGSLRAIRHLFCAGQSGRQVNSPVLKTDVLSVAHLRLGDLVKAEREHLEVRTKAGRGKLTFDQAVEIGRKQVVDHPKLKPTSAKLYLQRNIDALVNTWPGPTSIEAASVRLSVKLFA